VGFSLSTGKAQRNGQKAHAGEKKIAADCHSLPGLAMLSDSSGPAVVEGMPMPPETSEVTDLLIAWSQGDERAPEKLAPLVYDELHRLAEHYFRNERSGHTLQPTALVHEAWLRLAQTNRMTWQNRAHFIGVAAEMMRRVLVDHARRRRARDGAETKFTLDEALDVPKEQSVDLVALDEALNSLNRLDPRQRRIVELKFFGGLEIAEIAEVLGLSPATIKRDWAWARTWLHREISRQ